MLLIYHTTWLKLCVHNLDDHDIVYLFLGAENSDKLIDLAIGNSSSNTTFSSKLKFFKGAYSQFFSFFHY